jgi:hypothetical protein
VSFEVSHSVVDIENSGLLEHMLCSGCFNVS